MRTLNPTKHQQHRDRIITAARKLFADQGVKETSMLEVAKACKVTKATLYHYFASKEEILIAIFEHTLTEQERFVDSVKRDGPLEQTLYVIGKSYLEMLEQPETLQMLKIFHTEGMKSSMACKHYNGRMKERMDNYLKLGIERDILPLADPVLLRNVVFTFFGSLEHYFMHERILKCAIVGGTGDDYLRFLARMYRFALEAIGAQAAGQIDKKSKEKRT